MTAILLLLFAQLPLPETADEPASAETPCVRTVRVAVIEINSLVRDGDVSTPRVVGWDFEWDRHERKWLTVRRLEESAVQCCVFFEHGLWKCWVSHRKMMIESDVCSESVTPFNIDAFADVQNLIQN